MKLVEPYIVLWGKTQILPDAVRLWLKKKGVDDSFIDMILDSQKTHAERAVEIAGRRCYMSYQPELNPNVTKIRTNIVEYINNVLKSAHGSVLEHVVFNFAIENVSRVFTGEMNRHRAGMAISEGSMRYIRYTDIPFWIPTCWKKDETPTTFPTGAMYSYKECASREIMQRVFKFVEEQYRNLTELWKDELGPDSKFSKKKELTSAMRRIIPMGVATGGVWSGNIRALRHIFEMRCSPHAEEEILLVATLMLNVMKDSEPVLFGDFSTDDLGFSKPKYHKV